MLNVEELKKHYSHLEFSQEYQNIFEMIYNGEEKFINIVGKAGTGKSSLLSILNFWLSHKNVVTCSTTGVASALLNASYSEIRATTLHSAFQLPIQNFYGNSINLKKISPNVKALIQTIDYLFIDEVSMLNASLMDYLIEMLKLVRGSLGMEMPTIVMFNDCLQLPPVINTKDETLMNYFKDVYNGNYFYFNSNSFKDLEFKTIQLTKVYRQKNDTDFVEVLNRIRIGEPTAEDLAFINKRVINEREWMNEHNESLKICTTNREVQLANTMALEDIDSPYINIKAEINGLFRESPEFKSGSFEEEIKVKLGCPVMITRNDLGESKQFYNGNMGILKDFDYDEQVATVELEDEYGKRLVRVPRFKTPYYQYSVVEEEEGKRSVDTMLLGEYINVAIKPCKSLTVHKTQGLSLNKGYLSLGIWIPPSSIYVALSRFRKKEDFALNRPLTLKDIKVDKEALTFIKKLNKKVKVKKE